MLHFPDERAVFSADILQVRRLPGGARANVGAWIDALRTITALDFDHALTGHALAGTKKDAADLLRYLEDSRQASRRASRLAGARGDPEDAHARRLQGLGAVGHESARRTSQPSMRRSPGRAVAVPREPAPNDSWPE